MWIDTVQTLMGDYWVVRRNAVIPICTCWLKVSKFPANKAMRCILSWFSLTHSWLPKQLLVKEWACIVCVCFSCSPFCMTQLPQGWEGAGAPRSPSCLSQPHPYLGTEHWSPCADGCCPRWSGGAASSCCWWQGREGLCLSACGDKEEKVSLVNWQRITG